MVNKVFYRLLVKARPFHVAQGCTRCVCRYPEKLNLCANLGVYGLIAEDDVHFNGWFAEYILIRKNSSIFVVNDMTLDERMLIEPACVCVHSLARAKPLDIIDFSSTVLVQGCGPIGLMQIAVLKAHGVVQCTGVPQAAADAYKYVRRGGGYCEMGFFVNAGECTMNPHFGLCNKEFNLVGSWVYGANEYITTLGFLKKAKEMGIPVEKLVTHHYILDQYVEAVEKNISLTGIKTAICP